MLSEPRPFPQSKQMMASLESILIFVLLYEVGVSQESISVYKTPGNDVTLSCGSLSSTDTTCSNVSWFYNRDFVPTVIEVQNGSIDMNSTRAARLSLNSNCSLVINEITAEDAGAYTCLQERNRDQPKKTYTSIYLGVLTISPSPPDNDPNRDGEVILQCSLWRFRGLSTCKPNSLRWVNEKGTMLLGEGLEHEFLGQTNCDSRLKVKHPSGNNRTFTCQVVNQNKVEIEAEYPPVSLDIKGEDQTETPDSVSTNQPLSAIMWTLRVTGLILMIVITVLLIRDRGFRKPADENNVHFNGDKVTYENAEAGPAASTQH